MLIMNAYCVLYRQNPFDRKKDKRISNQTDKRWTDDLKYYFLTNDPLPNYIH